MAGSSEMILSAHHLAKVGVEGSNPFARSKNLNHLASFEAVLAIPSKRIASNRCKFDRSAFSGDLDDTCHADQERDSASPGRALAHEAGLVFPGEHATPISGWSKAKSALDTASGVSGWWLRRAALDAWSAHLLAAGKAG